MSSDSSDKNFFKSTAFDKDLIKWGPGAAVAITFATILLSIVIYAIVEAIYNVTNSDFSNRSLPLAAFPFIAAIPMILIPTFFAAFKTGSMKKGLAALGLKKTSLSLSFMLVALAFGITMLFQITVGFFVLPEQDVTEELQLSSGVLMFIGICLIVPFYEELLIRGFLFGGLRTKLSFLPAALISGAIFALLHFEGGLLNIAAIFIIMLFSSIILSFLYEKTGSLWPPIALHAAMNSTVFIFAG